MARVDNSDVAAFWVNPPTGSNYAEVINLSFPDFRDAHMILKLLVSRKRQAKTWARGMTEEEFLRREETLEDQEHAKDNFTAWALVPRSNTTTLDYPCSCETFRRKILVTKSGVIETHIGYGIASVFCAPEHRRKGYASHMMRLLHHVLAPPSALPEFPVEWGAPPPSIYPGVRDAQLSVLFSDIGDFYAQCGPTPTKPGWIIKDPISTIWKMDFITGIVSKSIDIPFEWLTEDKCKELWDLDSAYIKEEFSSMAVSIETLDSPGFTFLPSDGVAGYLLQRVLCEAPLIPENKEMKHFGVRMITKEEHVSSIYATWTLDMELSERPVITLTRLRSTAQYFPALMIQLMREASRINAKSIEVWNLPSGLVDIATNMGGRTKPRVDHLPAVTWYGPEDMQNVKWRFNEKYFFSNA
ncbi:hypothetical protein Clacol_005661 [Clathrus columnatus]|uniref:LYC1 C-terminal domain-containing protein n=1 Tax=Clathrus columnatus TaxID=1419009 RepID=A0AAV5AFJ6_9AGAM|nr:hypothetical protein Clacol_005661 [Clathrus columnatus]